MLAVQGPRARDLLAPLARGVAELPYFGHLATKIAKIPVRISRTGYTGDLGYEIWVGARMPWRSGTRSGRPVAAAHVIPIGMTALYMARIEAGLVLLDVDFQSSRYAWTDAQRTTPVELGLGWMLRGIEADDRAFIGRDAIRRELADRTSRWKLTGLVVDWREYDRIYDEAGLIPPKDHTPDPGRVLHLRRRAQPARLCHQPDVLADAAAPHRDGQGAARPPGAGLARQARAGRQPPLRILRRARDAAAPLQPRREGRPEMPKTKATTKADRSYDAIVIGGGHNGLVNGSYLAKAGLAR